MESFKVRKHANPSAYLGSVSTNFAYVSRFDNLVTRIGMFVAVSLLMISATSDFTIFYELFYHVPNPKFQTYYENSVPKELRKQND